MGGRARPGAQVRIFSPELRENRMTTTDVQGRYEFKELPATLLPSIARAQPKIAASR
jgi:hypothetical protein